MISGSKIKYMLFFTVFEYSEEGFRASKKGFNQIFIVSLSRYSGFSNCQCR